MLNWLLNNLDALWIIFSSLVTIASIIVKLTPTEKDNEIFNKIMKIIELISLNTKKK